jgi:WhiB family redox-sensing transcriptional regulator
LTVRLDIPLQVIHNDWEGRAACRGHDPSLFFGPNRFEPKRERLAREAAAKEICRRCPVRTECGQHALVTGESFGVWGGLGEAERRALAADEPARRAG